MFRCCRARRRNQMPLSFSHRLWAYLTLGATGIITEEATPLIGGLAAHDRRLHLSPSACGWPPEHGSPISGCIT